MSPIFQLSFQYHSNNRPDWSIFYKQIHHLNFFKALKMTDQISHYFTSKSTQPNSTRFKLSRYVFLLAEIGDSQSYHKDEQCPEKMRRDYQLQPREDNQLQPRKAKTAPTVAIHILQFLVQDLEVPAVKKLQSQPPHNEPKAIIAQVNLKTRK